MGCGMHKLAGYVNVDLFAECNPDVRCDLEVTPWPWNTGSVSEVIFNHCLEHIGADSRVFLGMMKELYRVCEDGAVVKINVPHPRHDNFIGDPTHVRIITPQMLTLFDEQLNKEWTEKGYANSPLALYLGVDFVIDSVNYILESPYSELYQNGEIDDDQLQLSIKEKNNVVSEIKIGLRVRKKDKQNIL